MPSGGNHPPRNPAPASGPGALSRRTDGGPEEQAAARWIPQDEYGAATELMDIQQSAPMRQQEVRQATPLNAPTQAPDEPITAGAPFGPGVGPRPEPPEPAPMAPRDDVSLIIIAAYAAHPSPELGALMNMLDAQGR